MKVIIAGSRDIIDYSLVCDVIKESGYEITEVVSGTARGVDRLGERWANENNIPIEPFPANWKPNGIFDKAAGYKRNRLMAEYADALIAISLNNSKGTRHMIDIMNTMEKMVHVKMINE